jgi:phage tail-like protein
VADPAVPALSHLFHAQIDMVDIGLWSEFSGLSATYDVEEYEEGGNNFFSHKFPGRLKYDNITLKRPLDKESDKLHGWFMSLMGASAVRTTASVTVYDADLKAVAAWNFIDVVPVKWTGPTFNAGQEGVAMEQVEFAHHGFTRWTA